MEMTYQERLFFIDRYKNVVYDYTTEDLNKYILKYKKDESIDFDKLKENVSEKWVRKLGDTKFEYIIKRYVERDCDYTYTRDCADELTRKIKEYWGIL